MVLGTAPAGNGAVLGSKSSTTTAGLLHTRAFGKRPLAVATLPGMPYLDRGGVRLYHEVHGRPDARPLILLEGMGGDIPGWRRNLPRLSDAFRVIAHDFRGNGRSPMPDEPATMATFVDDTLALMDMLGIQRGFLYGQSFGGFVAQVLALDHPHRVLGLVLGATHFGGPKVVRPATKVPKGQPYRALYAPGFPAAHPQHVTEDLFAGAPTRQLPDARRRQGEAAAGFDVHDRLPELSVPVLVVHGTADQMVPVANARALAERIPGAQLHLFEGAGHVYHSERAEESDRVVLEFLSRIPA